ncbi:hypothetical protein ACWEJ6_48415 [Nonomuraea sp. NPDC004702]
MLERDGWQAVVGAVPPDGVVEVTDPGPHLQTSIGPSVETMAVGELDLQHADEGFGGSIVGDANPATDWTTPRRGHRCWQRAAVSFEPPFIWEIALSTSPPRVATTIRGQARANATS